MLPLVELFEIQKHKYGLSDTFSTISPRLLGVRKSSWVFWVALVVLCIDIVSTVHWRAINVSFDHRERVGDLEENSHFLSQLRFTNRLAIDFRTCKVPGNARFRQSIIPMKNAQDRFSKKCFKNFLDRFFEKIFKILMIFEKVKIFISPKFRVDGASMDRRCRGRPELFRTPKNSF